MKRTIRGTVLILAGLALSCAAMVMFSAYERQADVAGENAELLLQDLRQEMETVHPEDRTGPVHEESGTEMPQTTLNGYGLVGIIQVPAAGLELPVLDNWSYDLLQISPCRYSGSVAEGNLILLGHNYKKHFAPLKKLTAGDEVRFSAVDGAVYTYKVETTEILQKTELERLTSSGYDLTLFTCTNGGYSRFVVRCGMVPAEPEAEQN